MRKQVIQILSDHEQEEIMKNKQEMLLQRQLEEEAALLGDSTSYILAYNSKFIPGTPAEKSRVLMERIRKMYVDKLKFDAAKDFFCLRRQPKYNELDCEMVLNEIMVYGTEFWPTRQIKNDAEKLKIKVHPIKIDESHTRLVFDDNATAKKWLQFYIKDKSILSTKMQYQMDQNAEQQPKLGRLSKIKGWFDLHPYLYQGFSRLRVARFCTNSQQNIQQLKDDIKMASFAQFKQYVASQLMKTEQARAAYLRAQQRNFHGRKYYKGQTNYNYYHNESRSYRHDRHDDRYRHRDREYDKRDRTRYKRDQIQKDQINNVVLEKNNKTAIQTSPIHKIPTQTQVNQTNILNQIRDDTSSYSFVLEGNGNPDMSIANALTLMTLQQGELDMSIDLLPANNANIRPNYIDFDMSIEVPPAKVAQKDVDVDMKKKDKDKGKEKHKHKHKHKHRDRSESSSSSSSSSSSRCKEEKKKKESESEKQKQRKRQKQREQQKQRQRERQRKRERQRREKKSQQAEFTYEDYVKYVTQEVIQEDAVKIKQFKQNH